MEPLDIKRELNRKESNMFSADRADCLILLCDGRASNIQDNYLMIQ